MGLIVPIFIISYISFRFLEDPISHTFQARVTYEGGQNDKEGGVEEDDDQFKQLESN